MTDETEDDPHDPGFWGRAAARLQIELNKANVDRDKLRAGECLGIIPETVIACGEGGNYCSEACKLKREIAALHREMEDQLENSDEQVALLSSTPRQSGMEKKHEEWVLFTLNFLHGYGVPAGDDGQIEIPARLKELHERHCREIYQAEQRTTRAVQELREAKDLAATIIAVKDQEIEALTKDRDAWKAECMRARAAERDATGANDKRFPIMGGPSIPWSLIAPYAVQAKENHDQTLERLAERGGLAPGELWCLVHGERWRMQPGEQLAKEWFAGWLAKHEGYRAERDAARAELAMRRNLIVGIDPAAKDGDRSAEIHFINKGGEKKIAIRGVDFACEECKELKGSHLEDGWYRCNNCGYPSK